MSSRLAALVGSVRVRLTFAVSIIFAGALTLASFGLVRQVENALVNDVQVRNDTVAQALGKILSAGNPDALSTSDPTQLADGLSGTYDADAGWYGVNPAFDVNLIAEGGRARVTSADVDLTWQPSAAGPDVYEADRKSTRLNSSH